MGDVLLLKVEAAAERLGVSRSTLYEALRKSEIESVLIGAARRIPVDALEAYVARLRDDQGS